MQVDLGLLIVRAAVGLVFAAHGAQKVFGWWDGPGLSGWAAAMERMGLRPRWPWALVSALTELVGGLLLALGALTAVASALLLAQSVVIVFRAHWPRGFWNRDGGIEFPLVLLAGSAAIATAGPGAISLDRAIGLSVPDPARLALLALAVAGAAAALLMRPAAAPESAR